MSANTLHDLNQRYIRLTDRCRSQWTFYQFLQGLYKHLISAPCPLDIDYSSIFNDLKDISNQLSSPMMTKVDQGMKTIGQRLETQAARLIEIDRNTPPSYLRRFFDRLRNQDEKVLLAIIKFYLDSAEIDEAILDKLHILLTRLAEIPRDDGGSLVREKHEIERLVQPLLQYRQGTHPTADSEVEILLRAISDLKAEVLSSRTFAEMITGGALDRFRTLKRRLGANMLHPRLLPALLDTTVTIKNRFRELWQYEEPQLLNDTNRVKDLQRQLESHPEMITPEMREALEGFTIAHRRYEEGKQEDNLRREDILELRHSLNHILEQFDNNHQTPSEFNSHPKSVEPAVDAEDLDEEALPSEPLPAGQSDTGLPYDPLLQEAFSKIIFALELVGRETPPGEAIRAKEMVSLRLDSCEVEACQIVLRGRAKPGTLAGERARLIFQCAALRLRMDEEAREIDRLDRLGMDRLDQLLERATQSLNRAAEMERRMSWLIDDALYRGETENLEKLHRSRFRLIRAYSGLWLIHNDRGGISPF